MTAQTLAAAMPQHTPTVLPTEPVKGVNGGEGGDFQITNAEFIAAVFMGLPDSAFAAVCSKRGDPSIGGWLASRADQMATSLAAENNNYLGCSSFYPGDDGSFKARKTQFSACHFVMLDLGTKVPLDRLDGFELSWLSACGGGFSAKGARWIRESVRNGGEGGVAVRAANNILITNAEIDRAQPVGRTREVWQPRLGRDLSPEDARHIAANVTGYFSVLAEWSRVEMPTPANDTGKPVASNDKELRHDR